MPSLTSLSKHEVVAEAAAAPRGLWPRGCMTSKSTASESSLIVVGSSELKNSSLCISEDLGCSSASMGGGDDLKAEVPLSTDSEDFSCSLGGGVGGQNGSSANSR